MRTSIVGLLLLGFVGAALAIDKAELDRRVGALTSKFELMQSRGDKAIPPETLARAEGVILLDRTKAGFLFAYQGGSGVALLKDRKFGKWGPIAFLAANEASLGFQIGGQQSFVVILLMDTNATRLLTEPSFEFGGEARGTAGTVSTGAEGTVSTVEQAVLIFDDRKGLYGGAAIKGGAITPDEEANRVYYGQTLTMKEILSGEKVPASEAAAALAEKIGKHAKVARQ